MAAKSQEELKKKAAMIAEEAKTTAKKAAKKDLEVNEEGEETVSAEQSDEDKKEVPVSLSETISEMNNNASAVDKKQVTEESANEFKRQSDEEDQFLRRSINIPSRRAMKKIFEHEEIIGDEFDEVVSEGQQRELEYQVLSDSAKAKKPKRLLGRVVGVEPLESSDGRVISYNAKVSLIMNPQDPETKALIKQRKEPKSIYSIYIPAPMFFFQRRPELFEGPEGLQNLYRAMKNKTNALVEFVVYNISPDDKRVIGSRIRAMQLKSHDYFLARDPRTNKRKAEVGSKCHARITEVGTKGITVEVCGAETFVPNDELSWLHINNPKNEGYKVGQSIPVVVKSVEVGQVDINKRKTQFVDITVSPKEATKKPLEKHGDEYQIGSTYSGFVSFRLNTGLYIVRIDEKVEAICYPPDFGTPRIGSECSVYLNDKNEVGFTGKFAYFE
ncbi:S1 RNA-binding domain-containing protein [Butyrivibrio sp. AE2005]|uniref:S1 RNA-binding domain-containing protein n=1 Tax=Butyrivibrio sp. AE2005 TaxID=1496722 RepID=UPI00047933C5|nr:S1 RNA-binding domain-containing protein [Butyrivibrio sp. AE2005]